MMFTNVVVICVTVLSFVLHQNGQALSASVLRPLPTRSSCPRQLSMQTRFSLASNAQRMHSTPYVPRLGLHTGFSTKSTTQREPAASARDILTHHGILLVPQLVHLLIILSVC